MSNPVYKRLAILSAVMLIAACAPKPIVHHDDYYKDLGQQGSQPPVVQPPTNEVLQPDVPLSGTQEPSVTPLTGAYANSAAARNFISYMMQTHGFSENYLNGLLSKTTHLASVVSLEEPPPVTETSLADSKVGAWSRYRKKFLTQMHINGGVEFWRANAAAIQKASTKYQVDPEYLVAIIGVETFFGRNVGKTKTLDALSTLAFSTKRRTKFFTSELEHFLLMMREESYDPHTIVGSWAGAMGLGQFMPSSFRRLAVDFNGDGKRDLWNATDAIGSVAHYFTRNGWKYRQPVANPSQQTFDPAILRLSTYSGDELWKTYPNFKVIKRYNNNDYYAMAVHQLSQAIKQKATQQAGNF